MTNQRNDDKRYYTDDEQKTEIEHALDILRQMADDDNPELIEPQPLEGDNADE